MKKGPLPYTEGTWFAVPLEGSGYALGVIARSSGAGVVFGYFFGPKRKSMPRLEEAEGLHAGNASWLGRFGDLGLLRGDWPILGRLDSWQRELWPVPPFIRVDEFSGKAIKVVYSDRDLKLVSEEPCDPTLAKQYPKEVMSGAGAVELRLAGLLGSGDG